VRVAGNVLLPGCQHQHLSFTHGVGDGCSCLGRECTPCLEDLLGIADEAHRPQDRPMVGQHHDDPLRGVERGQALGDDDVGNLVGREGRGQRRGHALQALRPLGSPFRRLSRLLLAHQQEGPLGLSPFALRDVAEIPGEPRSLAQAHWGDGQLDRKRGPVRAHGRHLDPPVEHWAVAGGEIALQTVLVRRTQGRGKDEVGQRLAKRLGTAVAKRLLSGGVELGDTTRVIDADNTIQCCLEDDGKKLSRSFALRSCRLTSGTAAAHMASG
jgi:hypothetical protein